VRLAIVAWLLLAACSERERPEQRKEPERPHRVIEPPSGRVRPLPPHAIRADGVGPYRIGAPVTDLEQLLPSGLRFATIEIPNVVHRRLLHAEDDTIVIGTDTPNGKTTFVAVVGSEVARTESGIHVGSTRDEVIRALGEPADDPEHARDPRLLVPSNMRHLRVVLDDARERVVALVIEGEDGAGAAAGAPADAELLPRAEAEKVLARVPGFAFAAVLRDPADGRDELVVIAHADDTQQRTWNLRTFRSDGNRFVLSIEPFALYQLTAANARWIGAELKDLDLYLELRSRGDAIEVGGVLTTRSADKLRDVVVISPAVVPRKHAKSAALEPADAGTSDAAHESNAPNPDHHPP